MPSRHFHTDWQFSFSRTRGGYLKLSEKNPFSVCFARNRPCSQPLQWLEKLTGKSLRSLPTSLPLCLTSAPSLLLVLILVFFHNKNSFISMEFTSNPRYSACCLNVKTDFFSFPENLTLPTTAMSAVYAPDIALGLLPR